MERTNNLLEVSHEVHGDGVVVTARGELDMLTTPQLTKELVTACKTVEAPGPVVVDLTEITFIGSAAIGQLAQTHQECTDAGTPLRIVAADRLVLRPLKLVGLDTTLHIADKLEEALTAPIAEPKSSQTRE